MSSKIAIFASGSGSNAEKIIQHFQNIDSITVSLILSNNPHAYVLERAKKFNVPTITFTKEEFRDSSKVLAELKSQQIDWIVLAGFLWLIPLTFVESFPQRIINIHPALLPKYGGKGMYGKHVHQAVFDNFEKETGITIHYVNEAYDEGQIIFQKSVSLASMDTPDIIAQKVHQLEHEHFPTVLENVILNK